VNVNLKENTIFVVILHGIAILLYIQIDSTDICIGYLAHRAAKCFLKIITSIIRLNHVLVEVHGEEAHISLTFTQNVQHLLQKHAVT
jgi:hypothetical protein